MNLARTPTRHRLLNGQFLHFRRPRRLCLRAMQGTLWITVDGELEDIVLGRGECRVFDGRASVIVTALDGAAALTAWSLDPTPTWRERLAAAARFAVDALGAPPFARRPSVGAD